MRIKFIKIEEGEVKRRNKAAKKAWEEKQGKRTEGHRGTFVAAAQKQVAKGKDKSTQAGVKAGYRGVARAAGYDKPGPHKGNLAGDYAKEFGSPNAAMRHGRKGGKLRHDSSTEILGNKIVEGFNSILEVKAGNVKDAAKKRKGSFTKTGYNPRTGRNEDITSVPGKRSRTTVADVEGGVMVGREGPKGYRTRKVNASTEILGDKIVEGFNQFLDRMDELSRELKARAAKAAKKKAKEHAKIASAAGKVKARDTEAIHDKISRSKKAQADRFAGKAGGEDKRGKQQYHQAKKEAGIGTRRVPVSKR